MPTAPSLVACVERALKSLLAASDVAGIALLIANEIEADFAGLTVYFTNARRREIRDTLIVAEYAQGVSVGHLARRYRLSARRVRDILKKRGKFFTRKVPRQRMTLKPGGYHAQR